MSQLDALLARSRAPGRFVEKRTFTLARSKAIEKMREFTLRHPRQYVLELVQAAVFAEARWIAVDVTSEALVVAWVGGRTLGRDELEGLFDYLFADQGEASTRHLMQTAVGVNAILQRKPRRIRIESGTGDPAGTVRMDLDARGKADLGQAESPLAGTYLYADFGRSWLSRFSSTDTFPPEAQLVETRCLYTPVPILLNGQAPFGYRSTDRVQLFGLQDVAPLTRGRRGAIGHAGGTTSTFRLVIGGVWVTDRDVPQLGTGLAGVIGDDRLRKTADMSDIVEDARWIDMLHAVQPTATDILRTRKGIAYQPPRLPPRIDERTTGDDPVQVAREPLPLVIPQLHPRAPLAHAELSSMETQEPLFWIEDDLTEALLAPCDPQVFPYRVTVLSPGQARTVEGMLPDGVGLSRLTNAEDVSFVRNAMERRGALHRVSVETDLHLAGGGQPVPIRMTLRLHLDGPRPRWDARATGHVPVLYVHGGRTRACGAVDLPFQDVSVIVELLQDPPVPADQLQARLADPLAHRIQRAAWRLLPDSDSPQADPRRRRLELALLTDHGRPHLVRRDGQLGLTVHLPSSWQSAQASLLDAPLAATTDGTLNLRTLVDLQGTEATVTLSDPRDRALIEPLELHFGTGHVLTADDARAPLVVVARTLDSWVALSSQLTSEGQAEELLLFFPGRVTPAPRPGWRQTPSGIPGVIHLIRGGATPQDLRGGLAVLARALLANDQADWALRPDPERLTVARCRDMATLARLHVGLKTDSLGEITLRDSDSGLHSAASLVAGEPVALSARGGAGARDRPVLPMTLDQLRVIEEARARTGRDVPLPLLLDDDPDTWSEQAAHSDGWLVRLPVGWPGLTGWLGLRRPWDPTAAVLLETPSGLEVLPGFTTRIPCHGLLRLEGADRLAEGQQELLHFAGIQLYQALLRTLESDLHPDDRDVAHRYATTFCVLAARREEGHLRRGLARTLASRVPVPNADGTPWGTLRDWVESDPGARPPAPPGMPPQTTRVRDGRVDLPEDRSTLDLVAHPLQRALRAQVPRVTVLLVVVVDAPVRVALDATRSRHDTLVLTVDRTPLVERAIAGEDSAVGLVLLECSRRAIGWARAHGRTIDPLALHQALLAGRLVRG